MKNRLFSSILGLLFFLLCAEALPVYQCASPFGCDHTEDLISRISPDHISSSTAKYPNIIFIMSDDHTSQAISAYGGRLADIAPTPHIDRLAEEGILFNNAFVTNSICTPSRAAIFTGTYSHKNGVYKFTALDQSQPTLPKLMQKGGYQTAMIGKYHLHSNPAGFDYFSILPGQGDYHNPDFIETGDEHPSGWVQQGARTKFRGHSSDVIADQAIDYLKKKRSGDKPFALFTHFKAPHDPWEHAARYNDYLADVKIPEPHNLFDGHIFSGDDDVVSKSYQGRSDALRQTLQHIDDIGLNWSDPDQLKEETQHLEGRAKTAKIYQLYMKKYLRSVKGVDDNVGRILDYLDESGLAENTIVMYTGDQGFFLGEHGLYDKRFMYEEALRTPFLMRWSGKIKSGSVSEGMVLNVDFAPTIMEAAGMQPHPEMQGRSFVPIVREEGKIPPDWRKSMYYRYYYSHFETEPHYGIRTYDHKLIYFNRIDQWELYDLKKDPREMNNLYDNPENKEMALKLKKELNRLQTELEDDPDDNGESPNIGKLAPDPLHVSKDVNIGQGDLSILLRFRTDVGGTLFSMSDLTDDTNLDYSWKGNKTLFVRDSTLVFNDSDEDMIVENNISDNLWHTLAFVLNGKQPQIYVDGQLKLKNSLKISADKPAQTFNIGAGLDYYHGYRGYNFVGDISNVVAYDEVLTEEGIKAHANGRIPEGKTIFKWKK